MGDPSRREQSGPGAAQGRFGPLTRSAEEGVPEGQQRQRGRTLASRRRERLPVEDAANDKGVRLVGRHKALSQAGVTAAGSHRPRQQRLRASFTDGLAVLSDHGSERHPLKLRPRIPEEGEVAWLQLIVDHRPPHAARAGRATWYRGGGITGYGGGVGRAGTGAAERRGPGKLKGQVEWQPVGVDEGERPTGSAHYSSQAGKARTLKKAEG